MGPTVGKRRHQISLPPQMKLHRLFARAVSEGNAVARIFAPPRVGFRILMYHAVGTEAFGDDYGLFTLAPSRFKQHVEVLKQGTGQPVVPLEVGIDVSECSRIAITFDDGYLDNLRIAAPLLARQGLPFTVFITTSFAARREAGFLGPGELRELASLPGAAIGAHGATHKRLTECSDSELREELAGSKMWLVDVLGRDITAIAYPHGAVDARVRDAAAQAGYCIGVCSHFGINERSRDRMLLRRSVILGCDTQRVLRQKLHGDWDWLRWRTSDPAAA